MGSERSPQWTLVVWDHQQLRLKLISRVVAESGACSLWIERFSDIERLQCDSHCCVAVVSLGVCPIENTLGLEIIRRLKNNDFRVIAYEDGSHSWSMDVRCRVLLAGAFCLLDSAEETFAEKLQSKLVGIFQVQTKRQNEEKNIKDIMKKLGIVGESKAMFSLFRHILKVSTLSDLPILITGESGTGKELLAHAIHQLDPKRNNGPFVAVNCGAITPSLAESELFGYKRGAFTGADRDRKGLIRTAQGGVLFLDEIGELGKDLQAKLLRVLQEKRVLSIGEDREVPVDVRIIAATHRDLEQMVQQETFRADLLHRLNVLSVYIPPLRERVTDLKPLIDHFLAKYCSLIPTGTLSVEHEVVEAMARLELPGNVRQLGNLLQGALLNKTDNTPLSLSDLPAEVWQHICAQDKGCFVQIKPCCKDKEVRNPRSAVPPTEFFSDPATLLDYYGWNLSHSIEHCERLLLEAALHHAHDNQSQTAQLLGITPRSIYNKFRKHHLLKEC
jgi:Transcriptional regulator containing PAS, AAA-type ATPase, and DNA-binding domains